MDQKKRTEIASLGQFGLIDLLTSGFTPKNASTLKGAGDDAAVIAPGRGEAVLCTTDSFYEGVDFDLTYFPLKHLGYKAVTAGVSDILAMNALPAQITVSLGVSSKLPVEALQDLYEGIAFACKEQEIDLVGGDTRASMTGLVITVTTLGYAKKEKIVYRSGCSPTWRTPSRSSRATNTCLKNTSSRAPAPTSSVRWPKKRSAPRR